MKWKLLAKVTAIAILLFGIVDQANAQRHHQNSRNYQPRTKVVVVTTHRPVAAHRGNHPARRNHKVRHHNDYAPRYQAYNSRHRYNKHHRDCHYCYEHNDRRGYGRR